jgi:acetyl-CoA carboxylase beta subunit
MVNFIVLDVDNQAIGHVTALNQEEEIRDVEEAEEEEEEVVVEEVMVAGMTVVVLVSVVDVLVTSLGIHLLFFVTMSFVFFL